MQSAQQSTTNGPRRYRIWVQGHLDPAWSDWFDGMELRQEPDGSTLIVGLVVDQAALYGLISRARDLGLCLLAVTPLEQPA
ncbi:MAG TPA: hypothetical protein PKD53_15740 [Chloroflexaceae bacterium]|nr:hypothetical protein [Chloroflexaceae bacterium]